MIRFLLLALLALPARAESRLEITEQCFATGAGKMSFYPEQDLKRCGEPKPTWISGAIDFEDLPDEPVANESGSKLAIKYVTGAVAIMVDGREELRVDDPGGVDNAVNAAFWHGKDWVVEARGKIFINGKRIKPAPILADAYYYRFIGGQPFFFFQRFLGSARISYAGVALTEEYDRVAFGLCCEPGFANPRRNKDAVQFFGKRGSTWYLVTAKITETKKGSK